VNEVEAFNDEDAGLEQRMVRRLAVDAKTPDREVVDPYERNAAFDEVSSRVRRDVDEFLSERFLIPAPRRVDGPERQPLAGCGRTASSSSRFTDTESEIATTRAGPTTDARSNERTSSPLG